MNKGKNIKSILQRHNARLIPTEALRPAPCLNQMIVCAQQKPICFPLTLMVLAMALSSPVITTFYFIHASLLRARVCANGSGQAHPTRRSIIHCSHFLRGIHFFQEVIQKALNAYFLLAGVSGGGARVGAAGEGRWGCMEIQQIEPTKKKLPLHKLPAFPIDRNHSMFFC